MAPSQHRIGEITLCTYFLKKKPLTLPTATVVVAISTTTLSPDRAGAATQIGFVPNAALNKSIYNNNNFVFDWAARLGPGVLSYT